MMIMTQITKSIFALVLMIHTVATTAQRCLVSLESSLTQPLMKASTPSYQSSAEIALQDVNYYKKYYDLEWMRQLNLYTGEGFWELMLPNPEAEEEHCAIIPATRIFYSGPGEYQQPHSHRIEKKFVILYGGFHIWILQKGRLNTWNYYYCTSSIDIPAETIHCFMAGETGCVISDDTATAKTLCSCYAADEATSWYESKNKTKPCAPRTPWCELKSKDYTVTIDDLMDATLASMATINM